MRVRALVKCFVGNGLREPGSEFDLPDGRAINPDILELVEEEKPVERPTRRVAKKAAKKAAPKLETTEE
jgi:hypothetical protein